MYGQCTVLRVLQVSGVRHFVLQVGRFVRFTGVQSGTDSSYFTTGSFRFRSVSRYGVISFSQYGTQVTGTGTGTVTSGDVTGQFYGQCRV